MLRLTDIVSRFKYLPVVLVGAATLMGIEQGAQSQQADDALRALYQRPDAVPYPEDNPYSDAKAHLGKLLFFDPRLSGENNLSCASCHNPSFSWEDGQKTSVGVPMTRLGRHTPTVLNLAWGELFFWDGRAESLEEQALGPIASSVEMAQDLDQLVGKLQAIDGYSDLFEKAFPGTGITLENVGAAIATYERTIVSATAPFDRWIAGDESAISDAAKRGFALFNGKANCVACHEGWNFTDWGFHDIGLPDDQDLGRYEQLDIASLKHAFKTPGLRNIVERAPYMHDGSIRTLEAVVQHYNHGFVQRETVSESIFALGLTDDEVADLVAFLHTLSSDDPAVTYPKLPN